LTGLCGGMVLNARKRFERGLAVPPDTVPPATGTPLFKELLADQYASVPNHVAIKFYQWQQKPMKVQTHHKLMGIKTIGNSTMKEWPKVKKSIDQGRA
jgi:hypothetical protein